MATVFPLPPLIVPPGLAAARTVSVKGEFAKAHALARAVKEEAMAGEKTADFLLWQLAEAVEQMAGALSE